MRTIKYRFWDKQENRFFEPARRLNAMTLSITPNGEVIGHPNIGDMSSRFEINQFTGLLDKNGNKSFVYEGDIVSLEGIVIGNKYETPNLLKDKANLLIEGFGTKDWASTEKEGLARGLNYSE